MTTPDPTPTPTYADRVFRSGAGIAGGVLLLVLAFWLGGDALVRGTGRAPWIALAGLIFAVPLIFAYTLRPAVFAGADLLRIRNPFRSITVPWAAVTGVEARYTTDVQVEGGRFPMWAVPVSLRQRKRASRRQARAPRDVPQDPYNRTSVRPRIDHAAQAQLALADQAVVELRLLAEQGAERPGAQGAPVVRWAYELIAPSVAGLIVMIVLFVTG
ncbi:membrane protein [Streptomyces sp. AcH 505]|uniref:PH domain-containing protein n=1 Tax=unclassified Streptomyces TaxID=2593676 RepID=UPI000592352B|nr:PH domain-containing protein [Streptomyces sp. NBC_00370]KIF68276.1 membrane protein [Streptomyces sp. AcH 505]